MTPTTIDHLLICYHLPLTTYHYTLTIQEDANYSLLVYDMAHPAENI